MNQIQEIGFLLTRHSRDTKHGLETSYWVKTPNGPLKVVVEPQQALFFIEQSACESTQSLLAENQITKVTIRPLSLSTFKNKRVAGLYFEKLQDFYQARRLLKEHGITCYEDDFRPEERYLNERFITAGIEFTGQLKVNSNISVVSGAKCRPSNTPIELSMLSIDLECSMKGELYSIGAYADGVEKVFMIGQPQATTLDYLDWVDDEKSLLEHFIAWLNQIDPDILIGWNVVNFDLSLLDKRCQHYNIKFAIGRDGSVPYWRKHQSSEQQYIDIEGRVVLDGIDLLKTATYNFASFSLEHVSHELLGTGKIIDDVDNRVVEITEKFHHNKPALAQYNLEDCRLVWQIFQKTNLLDFAKLRAQLTGLEIDRAGGSVAAFTNLYLPKLHRAGYVAPNLGDGLQGLVSPGGYVMDSIPGLYKNVLVLDFKSLYPSIIRTFCIDPMGMVEGLKLPEQAIDGFDGAKFSREKHFLPQIIEQLWLERDIAKRDNNAVLSQAIKIIMNSFYGVLGSTGCRFFDPRLSGSITKRGHELLKLTKQWVEALGHRVIYGDTDSIFVFIGDTHDKAAAMKIGDELATFTNNKLQDYLSEKFSISSYLELEFETHFSKFFMPTIRGQEVGTKKRYAGLVETVDDNNEITQRIVYKGLETVRTDWTDLAKEFQQGLYHRVFNDLPVKEYVFEMTQRTLQGEFDKKLIYRKRIRRKLDKYVKNVPPHIKAARAADEKNKALGKPLKYQRRGQIAYYLTTQGPQAVEYLTAPIDYQLYVERQLKAVADAILPFVNTSFDEITDHQMSLF
ncbi:DNA polymerase II [Thalassotalea sp. LPB0316]|uniref:DNA polymerase II n=1 Tax=Thalassotalea sp. LPB0316 TaxID=2769490 RepID=UPI0018665280|nr:DNA polymerase II [Thalassotalea sp. LPB0316]QOL24887.1 DNA polymerase II [Thalassotalea sp. LPB0316]